MSRTGIEFEGDDEIGFAGIKGKDTAFCALHKVAVWKVNLLVGGGKRQKLDNISKGIVHSCGDRSPVLKGNKEDVCSVGEEKGRDRDTS